MENQLNITVVRHPGYPKIFVDQYEVVVKLSIPKIKEGESLKDAIIAEIEDMWNILYDVPTVCEDINLKEDK